MSSKPKTKSSKKMKPRITPSSGSFFDQFTTSHGNDSSEQKRFNMASRSKSEIDAYFPSMRNFMSKTSNSMSPSYQQSSRPHTANSRVPVYTANGTPHGYTPPYEGYNAPHCYGPADYNCHLPPDPHPFPFPAPYYGPSYRIRGSSPNPNFVPYNVQLQQAVHQCQIFGSSSFNHRSAPVSVRTTPSNSIPGTPHDASRRKDFGFQKSSCSTPSKISRQPSIQNSSSSASLSSKSRRFEAYLPLCEVQKAMKKGDVIEGVLRINPRNYEDAYISAPDGAMDIYIGGIVDRNRSMNGDKVAVRINPKYQWKILFDNIRIHWNEWSDQLVKCANEANISKNSHVHSYNFCDTSLSLASIPENACLINPAHNETSATHLQSTSVSTNSKCTSQCIKKHEDNSKLQQSTEKFRNVDSSNSNQPNFDVSKSSKKRVRRRRRKNAINAVAQCGETTIALNMYNGEKDSGGGTTANCEKYLSQNVTNQTTHLNLHPKEINDVQEIDHKNSETTVTTSKENITVFNVSHENNVTSDQHTSEAKQIDCSGANSNVISLNGDELNSACEKVNSSTSSIGGNSLEEMVNELNAMNVIENVCKSRKNKKKKKEKKSEESKSDKTKQFYNNHKMKKTYGLPDFILSLSVEDIIKLPFWTECVQKTGKVVHIFERNHPRIAGGRLKLTADRNTNYALFSPNDSKIPRMLIDMKQCPPDFFVHPEHYSQTLFLAKLEDWSETSMFPKGTLLKSLGNVGQIEAESEIILIENQIDDSEHDEKSCQQFTALLNVNNEFEIPQKERDTRRSFESECVFTIDPSTARDLDDALSVTELTDKAHNGRTLYEVGVHIADVSYFLLPGSECDLIARERTTSVYLVQKVIPMLPRILCEKLCSLNPGEEKLTFSVIWKMDFEGNIYEERLERTIIRSCVKLSYELAQDMINTPEKQWSQDSLPTIYGNWDATVISNRVNILMGIARNLRKRRFDSGALNIDATKISFVLDPASGLPIGFTPESRKESNFLVEEFMLAANMAVAHRIYNAFPNLAFLRRHAPPDAKLLREFQEFCENTNLRVDVSTPEKLKSTVSELVSESTVNSKVICHYFLRSLTMAVYFCSGMCASKETFQHYALNVPLYTHFTSPIRRYADVVVHRLLAASLNYSEDLKDDERDLHRLAKRCNDNKMAAANASEQSSKLFTNLYLKQVGPVIETGVVSQVLDHAFDVMLPKFGQMSRVFIDTLDLKSFQYRSQGKLHQLELIWNNVDESESLQIIRAFSTVSVRISVPENDIWKWSVTLLPNKKEEIR